MATVFNSDQMTKVLGTPAKLVKANEFGGRVRRAYFSKTLAASGLATGDSVILCKLPAGARVLGGTFCWNGTQGATATTAIGIAGTTGKYFVAAVTASAAMFGIANTQATNFGVETTVEETIQALNAAAAWTASSLLTGYIEYMTD